MTEFDLLNYFLILFKLDKYLDWLDSFSKEAGTEERLKKARAKMKAPGQKDKEEDVDDRMLALDNLEYYGADWK